MSEVPFVVGVLSRGQLQDTDPGAVILKGVGAQLSIADARDEQGLIAQLSGVDAILTRYPVRMTATIIGRLERCLHIQSGGIGVDMIDVEAATEQGIMVVNVPDVFVEEVATHAFALLLACQRRIVQQHHHVTSGQWGVSRPHLAPMGRLNQQTLGLVGFGRIGKAMARMAKGFGLSVIAHDPYLTHDVAAAEGVRLARLMEVMTQSDYVSLHTPLTKETRHLIGAEELRGMKPTAYLINTCRGPVVDEAALIQALREGWIAGAGLDVTEQEPIDPKNPMLTMTNCIITPHTASYSDPSSVERLERAAQEVARTAEGKLPRRVAIVNPAVLRHPRLARLESS